MRHRKNERELGKFAWLKLEEAEVDPSPRAVAQRTDEWNQHCDEQDDSGRVSDHRPARERLIMDDREGHRRRRAQRIPDNLTEEELMHEPTEKLHECLLPI